MNDIRSFKLQNGDTIDLVMKIGIDYREFGLQILRDVDAVNIIEQDCREKSMSIVEKILVEWLKGRGKRPVTWNTFVECLRKSKLIELADDVQKQFET